MGISIAKSWRLRVLPPIDCTLRLLFIEAVKVRLGVGNRSGIMRQRPDQAALRFVEPSALASDGSSESKSWPSTQHRRRTPGRAAPRSAATCCLRSRRHYSLLLLHAASGFPTLDALNGDNDSLLRLVQIRDLIGGQGWFDLHQYRMGPDGGFVMHWSRLVDAPIAAIMLAGAAVTGSMATGETVTLIVWPAALMATAIFLLIRIGKTVGDDWAILPRFIIGAAALHFIGIFAPGNIDHHNVQLVLTLAVLAALSAPSPGFAKGARPAYARCCRWLSAWKRCPTLRSPVSASQPAC